MGFILEFQLEDKGHRIHRVSRAWAIDKTEPNGHRHKELAPESAELRRATWQESAPALTPRVHILQFPLLPHTPFCCNVDPSAIEEDQGPLKGVKYMSQTSVICTILEIKAEIA